MNRLMLRGVRVVACSAVLGFALAATGSSSSSAVPAFAASVALPADGITPRDVAASNRKVGMAHAALVAMWSADFGLINQRFAAPDIIAYYRGVRTACGIVRSSNALYCPRDNTIYFDEVFVAAQAKQAAMELGTDGDMAAVGVIAHEMGHAVAIQLGYVSRSTYSNEATADCLAGAFARQAEWDGSLEEGDIDEAFYAMASAADPTPQLTGDRRVDGWILTRAAAMAHGTREQRTRNFQTGLEDGPRACLPQFRRLG